MGNRTNAFLLTASIAAVLLFTGAHFASREPSSRTPKASYRERKAAKEPSLPESQPAPSGSLAWSESPVHYYGSSSNFEQADREYQEIISKLERQGISRQNARQLEREDRPIPQDVVDYLSHTLNWMPELAKASSTVISGKSGDPSMLRLYNIDDDSILKSLGVQDGDIVALIDGRIPLFSPSRISEYTQMAWRFINTLEQGDPVSMTVMRRGKPIRLVYRRW